MIFLMIDKKDKQRRFIFTAAFAHIYQGLSYIYFFFYVIYSCDGKAEFSASLLQSSVSNDPSESR